MAASTSTEFCYSDNNAQHIPIQNLEIYNMTTTTQILGFPNSKTQNDDLPSTVTLLPNDAVYHKPTPLSLALNSAQFPPSSSRSSVNYNPQHAQGLGLYSVRNSKYLNPAQELLNEFCSLYVKGSDLRKKTQVEEDDEAQRKQSLYALDTVELQTRRAKLLHMLQEVNRKYKHYCHQMQTMVSSLEAVAGDGAATVYTTMASGAMSRHFRSLKDSILGQIKAIKKALGDKGKTTPSTTKGETPRLRILDQSLRQQRAYQQLSIMESNPWRPQRGLPEKSVNVLRAWLFEHFLNPYPNDVDKHILARQTGLSRSQVSNWFINARVRLWKPMVEEMYLEDQKESQSTTDRVVTDHNHASHAIQISDQKPTHNQLIRIEPDQTLSSIVDDFGPDFSSYAHHSSDFGNVSLTLGLHQHDGHGLGAEYTAVQNTVFYGQDDMEDCETTVEYSMMESENQNLPYRNLMGAQLLHDLAG